MADVKPQEIAGYFAHVPYLIAQVYLGIFSLLLLVPPIDFVIRVGDSQSLSHLVYQDLFDAYGRQWDRIISDLSAVEVGFLLFLTWPLGALIGEVAYRFGTLVHYHNDFNLDVGKPIHSQKHFEFRCRLLLSNAEYRLWDWQNFQFNIFYFFEVLLGLLFLTFSVALLRPLFVVPDAEQLLGTYTYLAVGVDVLAFALLLLMRTARKGKLEDFRETHRAVQAIFDKCVSENRPVSVPPSQTAGPPNEAVSGKREDPGDELEASD